MGFAPKKWTPVYEDNNACIEWGNNIIGGRERASTTSEQLADIFTKGLHAPAWKVCIPSILKGGRKPLA